MLKVGDQGAAVKAMQTELNKIMPGLHKLEVDGVFGPDTLSAVRAFQASRQIAQDGVFGPLTANALSKATAVTPQPVSSEATPWLDLMHKYSGKVETDPDFSKMLSAYWRPLTGLNFKTIAGNNYAWCALFINFALTQTGFKGDGSAAAVSFANYGTACEIKKGAIIVIRHATGGHHVTTFDSWVDEAGKIGRFFGGNQSNSVKLSTYNVSGNAFDHDEIMAVRWPVKA